MKDDGSVRADAVDIEIADTRVRVVCEDPAGVALLRSALAHHVVDEPAPLGFALRVPAGTTKFHVLFDRSGFVLARVRTTEEGVAVLGSYLAGLAPPPQAVRIRGRAFLSDDSTAALATPPLFLNQPVVERRLARISLRAIDRLTVDVGPDMVMVASTTPWPNLRDLPTAVGHAPAPGEPMPIGNVLVPQHGSAEPSRAMVVAHLAAATCSGASRADRLEFAERLSAHNVRFVAVGDLAAHYAALRR
ncbi:MAG: hypothetical protein ACI9N0_002900 [Ilumatobacter sp.]|jgi:hypothetical protein